MSNEPINGKQAQDIAMSWWQDNHPELGGVHLDFHEFGAGWISRPDNSDQGALVVDKTTGATTWYEPPVVVHQIPMRYRKEHGNPPLWVAAHRNP